MPDIIHLLPDSVANQIAAGEVVQRPASVVKELTENAVDAGATDIKVIIKDGGKTLIQVIDNGCGMSETDARMAFERHSTSKINKVDDLFAIRTMGFRGEALASIAAIAEVELKTKLTGEELGSHIIIAGSNVQSQQPTACPEGSNFIIKNLFYNVPARRKFLKSDSTELRYIIYEFQRIALANPGIRFLLTSNDSVIYQLSSDNLLKRIVALFGKSINQNLIAIGAKTHVVEISGFIGKPEFAKKKSGEQYFFVNNRYMKHPYFNHSVIGAYEKILPADYIPCYFIFLEVNPDTIDINIHPTKTEIKFEDEKVIWQLLQATIKQSLGKYNITPSIDFNTDGKFEIPLFRKDTVINPPEIKINHNFNPFQSNNKPSFGEKKPIENWEALFDKTEIENEAEKFQQQGNRVFSETVDVPGINYNPVYFQLKNKYIITAVKSGLMLIDQKRAHVRILFEKFIKSLHNNYGIAQQDLFPRTIELEPSDYELLNELSGDLNKLGFDLRDFGKNMFVINGYPSDTFHDPVKIIENLLITYKESQNDIKIGIKEKIALSLAESCAINYGKSLTPEEMRELIDRLFACESPNYSPSGKKILIIIEMEELEKRF